MMTLKGRTCLFAGGAGDIGEGAVRALAEGGMNVVLITHNPGKAEAIREACKDAPGKVLIKTGVSSFADLLRDIREECGSLDVYINKTGGFSAPCSFEEITEEFLEDKLRHQAVHVFSEIKRLLPALKESRAPRILLFVNGGALDGSPEENPADSIARGAVTAMVKALAREYAPYGITVNAAALSGLIPDHRADPAKDLVWTEEQIPLGRLGTTEEFGAFVSYIVSEEAGFTTGHIFNLTGGRVIG